MRPVLAAGRLLAAALVAVPAVVTTHDKPSRGGRTEIEALAPIDAVAERFNAISALAAAADGGILVASHAGGTLSRIDATGRRRVLLDDLQAPASIAVERGGGVLIVERSGGRLLRLFDGRVTIVSSGVSRIRAVAVGTDGRVWAVVRGARSGRRLASDAIVRLDVSGALVPFASGFKRVRAIAASADAVYVAGDGLFRVPVREGETAGTAQQLIVGEAARIQSLAADARGDLFVAVSTAGSDRTKILKLAAGGRAVAFASGFTVPLAVAFAPGGDLIAAETGGRARVLRFRAPPPPGLDLPRFTNQSPLTLRGSAEAGSQVVVWQADGPARAGLLATADADGQFRLGMPLASNALNSIEAAAIGAGGTGLAGGASHGEIVHDDVPPSIAVTLPVAGSHVRGAIAVAARVEDDRSGIAGAAWGVDDGVAFETEVAGPYGPREVAGEAASSAIEEGPHWIAVQARDRAGNRTAQRQPIVVDRTPPDTSILNAPAAEITERTVTLAIAGSDTWSAADQLEFAWRLDEGPWSTFGPEASIAVSSLGPGPHVFEARARDRAGNTDPTPVQAAFRIRSLAVRIIEPASATSMAGSSVWVRGVVESSGDPAITVSIAQDTLSPLGDAPIAAAAEAGTFAVEIPVLPGAATIDVIATDASGSEARDRVQISVAADAGGAPAALQVDEPAGFAPHSVTFGILEEDELARVTVDPGDGSQAFEGRSLRDQVFVYSRPGIYVATAAVLLEDGRFVEQRALVRVYSRDVLTSRVQSAWTEFKAALLDTDVPAALAVIHSDRRVAWDAYLNALAPELVAAAPSSLGSVELVGVGPDAAECELLREIDGLFYSFPVSFVADSDGRWRLWQF